MGSYYFVCAWFKKKQKVPEVSQYWCLTQLSSPYPLPYLANTAGHYTNKHGSKSLHTCLVCTRQHTRTHKGYTLSHTQRHAHSFCMSQACLISVSVLSRGADTWYLCPVNPSRITASAVCCFIYTWNIDVLNLTSWVLKCPFLPWEDGRPFPGNLQPCWKKSLSVLGLVDRVYLISLHWLVGTQSSNQWVISEWVCPVFGGQPVLCMRLRL